MAPTHRDVFAPPRVSDLGGSGPNPLPRSPATSHLPSAAPFPKTILDEWVPRQEHHPLPRPPNSFSRLVLPPSAQVTPDAALSVSPLQPPSLLRSSPAASAVPSPRSVPPLPACAAAARCWLFSSSQPALAVPVTTAEPPREPAALRSLRSHLPKG